LEKGKRKKMSNFNCGTLFTIIDSGQSQIIGKGSFGTVHKINFPVAVKVIDKSSMGPKALLAEIELSRKMADLGIGPKLYDFCEGEKHTYIITQIFQSNLFEYIRSLRGNKDETYIKGMAKQIEDKLRQKIQLLCKTGFICSDLKPQNVVINVDKDVVEDIRLIDWDTSYCKQMNLVEEEDEVACTTMFLMFAVTSVRFLEFGYILFFEDTIRKLQSNVILQEKITDFISRNKYIEVLFDGYAMHKTTVPELLLYIQSTISLYDQKKESSKTTSSSSIYNSSTFSSLDSATQRQILQRLIQTDDTISIRDILDKFRSLLISNDVLTSTMLSSALRYRRYQILRYIIQTPELTQKSGDWDSGFWIDLTYENKTEQNADLLDFILSSAELGNLNPEKTVKFMREIMNRIVAEKMMNDVMNVLLKHAQFLKKQNITGPYFYVYYIIRDDKVRNFFEEHQSEFGLNVSSEKQGKRKAETSTEERKEQRVESHFW